MADFKVVKAFNTSNRRLTVGMTVLADADLRPFTLEERRQSGFLKPTSGSASAPVPAAAPPRSGGDGAAAKKLEAVDET